ncbi:phage tail assembly chaperone [Pseudomonas sp. NPDC089554]|uniref:phage tail assembly chaperone n=1 Tax=Pseudomonas sp. NPDC089554 TaxID=3390653 RepID=UPI003D07D122
MKYFHNPVNGEVHAYETDAPAHFIAAGLVPMTDVEVEHYINSIMKSSVLPAVAERQWRDAELAALCWIRDRHRDQLEIGVATTLTAEKFSELLVFMQLLRDWPQSEAFPNKSSRPVQPEFLEQMRADQ